MIAGLLYGAIYLLHALLFLSVDNLKHGLALFVPGVLIGLYLWKTHSALTRGKTS